MQILEITRRKPKENSIYQYRVGQKTIDMDGEPQILSIELLADNPNFYKITYDPKSFDKIFYNKFFYQFGPRLCVYAAVSNFNITDMKKLYELPFQVVNKYEPLNERKYYKYVEQEYYKPSGSIKLTLLSEDYSDRIEITSDFEPTHYRDKKFIVQKSDLSDDLKKQLDYLLFVFYRSIFVTKSGRSHTCCTFETNSLKEIK